MEVWEASYIAGIIDGEGSITLTRMHQNEFRRPCISVASTDRELLYYLQTLIGGTITNKKNYKPNKHKDSFVLSIKNKKGVLTTLFEIAPYLKVNKKRERALYILNNYDLVTPRNGKYNSQMLKQKNDFEKNFFKL